MSLGFTEILLIALAVLVIFGAKRIPELARALANQILCQEGTILKTGCHAGDGRFFRTFQMELRSYAADFRFGNAELGKR